MKLLKNLEQVYYGLILFTDLYISVCYRLCLEFSVCSVHSVICGFYLMMLSVAMILYVLMVSERNMSMEQWWDDNRQGKSEVF